MWKVRVLALVIVAFAFLMRMDGLDSIRHDYDRSYPHGLGIAILEDIGKGKWSNLPVLSLITTADLPNPPGASYLWALVGLFDRSSYIATAIGAMLNVLAVAMTFDLGRRLFGPSPAVVAACLAAGSTWGAFLARGTWVQGLLEACAVISAWLVMVAILKGSRRRLLIGLLVTAVAMQTYALAYALIAQVAAICVVGCSRYRRLIRPALLGLAIGVVSIVGYLVLAQQNNGIITSILHNGLKNAGTPQPSWPNPFGLHLDFSGLDHALRFASGRDFQSVFLDRQASDFGLIDAAGRGRAGLVDALILIGVIIALVRSRHDLGSRLALTWFAVPVVASVALAAVLVHVQIPVYYLPLASPGGYLLAGIPFMVLDRNWLSRYSIGCIRPIAVGVVCLLVSAISYYHFNAQVIGNYQIAYDGNLIELPLRWQNNLGAIWRANCSEVDNWQTEYWLVSILQNTTQLRKSAASFNDSSAVWEVPQQGGNCVTTLGNMPLPVDVDTFPLSAGHGTLLTQRARPQQAIATPNPSFKPLTTNIGWTLLNLQVVPSAVAGEWVSVTEVWRVDSLPGEPYWSWYYAPFVNLMSTNNQAVAKADNATSINGWNWRVGDMIISTVRLQVPANLPAGHYTVVTSLYDPNQRKNAVYFNSVAPGKPVLTLDRPINITGHTQ